MSKKNLLAAELKKFKMISEYSFYIPDNELIDEADDELEDEEGGDEMPEPEGEPGAEPEISFDGEEIDPAMDDEAGMEPEAGMDDPGMEEPMDDLPEPEGDTNLDDDAMMGEPDTGEEEIELDVTELVDKSEAAKQSSDEANEKLNAMMQKFSELGERMSKMDMLDKKLEALQQDIAKRNPTEEEKLDLRSMNSYPYNVKLTDYWDDKDRGNYKVDNGEGQTFKKDGEDEYILTKDQVDSDYSEMSVKNTFDYKEEDM